MRLVRVYDGDGSFLGKKNPYQIAANNPDGIELSLRKTFNYHCLNLDCPKTYHHRVKHVREENTREVIEAFVENYKTDHVEGCGWDFEKIVSKHRGIVFSDGEFFHLRINFPLGSSWNDMHVGQVRLTREQRRAASNNINLQGISSMKAAIEFLEKQFGSLEAPELEYLKLHYQGRDYLWKDVFAANNNYSALIDVPTDNGTGNVDARMAVVKVVYEKEPNRSGKRRFTCAWMRGMVRGYEGKIAPILVCGTNEVAERVAACIEGNDTLLISARPYIPPGSLRNLSKTVRNVRVSLFIRALSQITSITGHGLWHPRTLQQMPLSLENSS